VEVSLSAGGEIGPKKLIGGFGGNAGRSSGRSEDDSACYED
jgi:hypothetical protein